jgi:hypothetical protein
MGSNTMGFKKFTPTEVKYSISEEEMYAVFGVVKKFEYELGEESLKSRLIIKH